MDPGSRTRQRKLTAAWLGAALALVLAIGAEVVFLDDYLWWAVGGTTLLFLSVAILLTRRIPTAAKGEPQVTVWELRTEQQRQLRRKSHPKSRATR